MTEILFPSQLSNVNSYHSLIICYILNIYPLRNSRIVQYNSGIGGQSENSHFAQDNSGIVPILTLRRTYIPLYVYMFS